MRYSVYKVDANGHRSFLSFYPGGLYIIEWRFQVEDAFLFSSLAAAQNYLKDEEAAGICEVYVKTGPDVLL